MSSQPELSQRKPDSVAVATETNGVTTHDHHDHYHSHSHSHAHSHSLDAFTAHPQAHGHDHGSAAEADALLAALKGRDHRGPNITFLCLLANILLLSTSEDLAGVYLNSAATVTAPGGEGGHGGGQDTFLSS